jgi:hypothetical protein
MGHYLGLEHTHEGGCGADNDGVADTPANLNAQEVAWGGRLTREVGSSHLFD